MKSDTCTEIPTAGNCNVCGTLTNWFESLTKSYICSEKCEKKAMNDAFALVIERGPSEAVANVLSEYTKTYLIGWKE